MKKSRILSSLSCILLLVFILTFRPVIVIGQSMMPTLKNKSFHLSVNKYVGRLFVHRGSIVAFSTDSSNEITDGKSLIKRVIGIEGDQIKIRNGEVYVNGSKVDEPYIMEESKEDNFDLTVPKGKMFCMGDNRNNSSDSRLKAIGYIDVKEQLEGVLIF